MSFSSEALPINSVSGSQNRGGLAAFTRKNKKPVIVFLSVLVLLAAVISVATIVTRKSRDQHENVAKIEASHGLIRSSCSATLFPELCFSTIGSTPSLAASLTTQKDVIEASINITILAVEGTYFKVLKLIAQRKLTSREKTALHDCLENVDETLDELRETYEDLKVYPAKKSITEQADDLKILLSAAMTNQETCLDGFSHNDADKKVRKVLEKGFKHVHHMCSNALAMICNMTNTDIANEKNSVTQERRLEEEEMGEGGFPSWLSAGDRKLLQSSSVTPDVTVAADGSGNFRTVSAAVAAAPEKSTKRYVIRIKAGVYRENVEIPKKKTNLMFVGDDRKTTIITGSRNVVDGSTTFNSATVAVVGTNFLARDITFQNTAGPSKHQAVALRVGSDHSAFYRCDMLAYQDTLYVHSLRQFFRSCFIAGTVDFIFGNAAVVFQDCDIHARRPNSGQSNMVTAQGRDDPNENTGIVIQNCRIGATSDLLPVSTSVKTFLGRPWKQYSRTVVMRTDISNVVRPEGWSPWTGNFALDTLYYAEYQNTGAGAGTSGRVKWKGFKVITSATEANQFTAGNFITGSSWLTSTGFPFSLTL
ncbi:pectinesterase-like [Aristolochia californica]|uniref:pectinesterase-like n=1 Tax=Aristolochia californica TaxID=171875 RepID=UPI0035DA7E11